MIDSQKLNILSDTLNVTFGKTSIRDRGYAVNYNIESVVDNSLDADPENVNKLILTLRFETGYHFDPSKGMTDQKKSLDKESVEVISKAMTQLKKDFKDVSGSTLGTKELEALDASMDAYSFNPSLVRGRYRRKVVYEIEFK